jgi:hypothetical protein
MTPTVDDFRNQIREATGRYSRVESTGFTKEALAALCETVDADVELEPLPGKDVMRTAIRRRVDGLDTARDGGKSFLKAELETIAATVSDS